MRTLLVAALCCYAAHAAVIRGVVLDRSTGRPLARSLVNLRPVDGTGGKPQSIRANRGGQFTFTVSAGMYLLRASRAGFAPFQYGQKDWKSAGKPMAVEQDGALYLDIRLRRYAAISGTVLDENEIGIPDQKVIAYPAKQPLQIAATATTDDRGTSTLTTLTSSLGVKPSALGRGMNPLLSPASSISAGWTAASLAAGGKLACCPGTRHNADAISTRPAAAAQRAGIRQAATGLGGATGRGPCA